MAARRYVRDRLGRFASAGAGATARGGRLTRKSGSHYDTQTKAVAGGQPKGTIGKPKGLKPGSIKPKAAAPAAKKPMTKAEYEAAARKAWGVTPGKAAAPAKQTADQQLDRLTTRSRNMQNARTGLTKAEAMKASELGKQTGRRVRVTQNENGSFAVSAAPARRDNRNGAAPAAKPAAPARRRGAVGKIDDAKADRIIQRHDAMRPGLRPATGSKNKSMNSINTFLRARKFLLEPSRKVAKKGETISGQESIRRAVAGASKKARKRK